MDEQVQKQHEASKREAIVDAAARVFAQKGFTGASNREIAREAGISPGLIYWYFQDKEELFMAVVGRLFPLYGLEVPDAGDDQIDLRQLLEHVGGQFMSIMTHQDVLRLARLALTELIRFPEVFQEVGRMISEQAVGRLATQLDAHIERNDLPPINSRLAAQAFFGSLMAYVLRKYMYQSVDLKDTPDEEMVSTVVRIFTAGLSVDLSSAHRQGGPR